MPSIVVKNLSDLTEKKGIARRDPIFQIYEHVIVSDDEPRDGLPSMPSRNIYDDMHDILENLPVEEDMLPIMPVPMSDSAPPPSIVVKHLSDLAEKKGIARRDPIFQIYEHVIVRFKGASNPFLSSAITASSVVLMVFPRTAPRSGPQILYAL